MIGLCLIVALLPMLCLVFPMFMVESSLCVQYYIGYEKEKKRQKWWNLGLVIVVIIVVLLIVSIANCIIYDKNNPPAITQDNCVELNPDGFFLKTYYHDETATFHIVRFDFSRKMPHIGLRELNEIEQAKMDRWINENYEFFKMLKGGEE